MRNLMNSSVVLGALIVLVLGCSAPKENSAVTNTNTNPAVNVQSNSPTAAAEPQIEVTAKVLTKAYDENELAADGKYKDKTIKVSGKIKEIAETLGNVTVQLEGHDFLRDVMCSFEESERNNVAKLKKGQQMTMVGRGDGMTLGIYVGLRECKVQ